MHTFLEVVQEIKKAFDAADDVVLSTIEDTREETSVATSAHAVDTFLIYNKTLYRVIAPIAVGDTLTVGTNIDASEDIVTMILGKETKATILWQTLAIGSTSVTFTNLPTTGNHLIDFFTSNGINYTEIDTSTAGQVTLTFDEQDVAVTVYCKISEV